MPVVASCFASKKQPEEIWNNSVSNISHANFGKGKQKYVPGQFHGSGFLIQCVKYLIGK
jgi:hypothetical protein